MQTDKDNCDKILAFDSIYTNNHIQMYKLLLPYFEPEMQKKMAIYIKFMEFQYTLSYFKNHPYACQPRQPMPDADVLCKELSPYCNREEKQKLDRFSRYSSSVKNAQEMMEMAAMMKDMFPEGAPFPADGDGSMDISQILSMLGKQ
ncbi:MAG: hypothetical protein UDQ92_08780 [Lachnospiraceae bacterium]|nr:hypothetical protein [Lachnospiraceae bacterium]